MTTHSPPQQQQQQRRRRRPNVLITGTPGTGKTTLAARIVERLNHTPDDDNDTNQNVHDATDHNTTMRAKHVNVGEIIQTHQFYDGYDTELDTHILEEDRLMDYLDDIFVETLQKNNPEHNDDDDDNDDEHYSLSLIADYHICEIFPERYFDLVIVLRTDTERLYDRYLERNYHRRPPPVSTTGTTTTTTPPETTTTTTPKITANLQCEIMNVIWERALDAYAPEIVVPLPSNTVDDMESNVNRVLQWIQLWMQQQQQEQQNSE